MKKNKTIFLHLVPILIFLILYTCINAYNIVSKPTPFYDWDESIYMQVGKEMVQSRSLIPLWQGHPWLEKPPLIPFVFGLTTLIPLQTEVGARLISLAATIGVLVLVFLWAQKILNNPWLSTLMVVLTAFNPIFVQRAQVVNGDTFLLAGWLGYFLFSSSFWVSFAFLFLGVMSKSLLGFYPAILFTAFHLYRYWFEKKKHELKNLRPILMQVAVLSTWYVAMFVMYKGLFMEVHFQDHLLRRVTQSIESHFGQRTFYLDIVVAQYGWYLIVAGIGIFCASMLFFKKRIDSTQLFTLLFLAPWFVFLNLTKTKISWYLYPAVPLFPLLFLYPFSFIRLKKPVVAVVSFVAIGLVLNVNILRGEFFKGSFSQYDSYYRTAREARLHCKALYILVSPTDRQTHDTLKQLGLLLSTTEWYDGHPAMIYYSEVPTLFVYEKKDLADELKLMEKQACVAMEQKDEDMSLQTKGFSLLRSFDPLLLMQRN